jgi:hypothetical protein
LILGVVQLNLSTSKLSTLSLAISSFQKDIERVVVTAYAEALADAYNYRNRNGCLAFVNTQGCIWVDGNSDVLYGGCGCVAVAYSEGAVESRDIVTEAGVSLFSLH